eukprot:353869_1
MQSIEISINDDKGTRLRVEECIAIQLERPTMIRLSSNGLHGYSSIDCIHTISLSLSSWNEVTQYGMYMVRIFVWLLFDDIIDIRRTIFTRLRANPFGYNYRAIHCSYLDPFTVTHLTSFAVNPYRIGASKSACSVDNSLVFSAVDSLGMALPFNCKHTHILRRAFGFNMYGSLNCSDWKKKTSSRKELQRLERNMSGP